MKRCKCSDCKNYSTKKWYDNSFLKYMTILSCGLFIITLNLMIHLFRVICLGIPVINERVIEQEMAMTSYLGDTHKRTLDKQYFNKKGEGLE